MLNPGQTLMKRYLSPKKALSEADEKRHREVKTGYKWRQLWTRLKWRWNWGRMSRPRGRCGRRGDLWGRKRRAMRNVACKDQSGSRVAPRARARAKRRRIYGCKAPREGARGLLRMGGFCQKGQRRRTSTSARWKRTTRCEGGAWRRHREY